MKQYLFYLIIILTVSSCQKDFLDRNPFGVIDENTFYSAPAHADLAAIGCYSKLQTLNNHWAQAQLELGMSDDLSSVGFKDAQQFYAATFNPTESNIVKGVWQRSYQGIAICNAAIQRTQAMPASVISDEEKNKYLGEMRFLRAFWYLRLIQFYGDVPLRTQAVEDPLDKSQVQVKATAKAEILSGFIVPELQFAAENLPDKWSDKLAHRATKGAAYAYLCEAYMLLKDWNNALDAGRMVETFGYTLINNPGNVLRVDHEDSKEIIFSVGFGVGAETYREYYFGTIEDLGAQGRLMRGDTYSGDYFYPSANFIDYFEVIDGTKITEGSAYYNPAEKWKYRDPRFDATFFTTMDTITTTKGIVLAWDNKWLVNKATGFDIQKRGVWYGDNTWNRHADIHFMRLPRIFLYMAEAYARQSDFENCSIYLEKVRSRARNFAFSNQAKYIPGGLVNTRVMPPHPVQNWDEAFTAIDYESRVEFFAEDCIRYFDLKRWDVLQTRWPANGGFQWDEKLYNLPIPVDELNTNPLLNQNHSNWGS